MSGIAAIPTTYKGLLFRSRLEAQWAAFFDELGWEWEYEPLDLDGYIPDFVLLFETPMLVEVKPELSLSKLKDHTKKIEGSRWNGNALIVGAKLFSWDDAPSLGVLGQQGKGKWTWLPVGLRYCACSPRGSASIAIWDASLNRTVCCKCGTKLVDFNEEWVDGVLLEQMWFAAKNATQWHSR